MTQEIVVINPHHLLSSRLIRKINSRIYSTLMSSSKLLNRKKKRRNRILTSVILGILTISQLQSRGNKTSKLTIHLRSLNPRFNTKIPTNTFTLNNNSNTNNPSNNHSYFNLLISNNNLPLIATYSKVKT